MNTDTASTSSSNTSMSSSMSTGSKKKLIIKKTAKKPASDTNGDKKKASEIYQKMEHKEHIYKKPDTYTGSCEVEDYQTFVIESNEDVNHIVSKIIKLTPGFYKCFDELLVNAHDHKKRMEKVMETDKTPHYPVTSIKISINEDQSITFYNDGDGILVEYMEEHNMYPPELIFGTLLTSTNYDDTEQREWGGRNGYGAKLANIFSKRFDVETVCHIHKKKFKQSFTNNMNERTKAKVTENSGKPYTKITWLPDYERFGMPGLTDDIKSLIKRRVYDIAGVTDKNTKVYFNDVQVEVKTFDKYVDLYLPASGKSKVYDEGLGWQIVASSSDDDVFEQVSFVNGINTIRGGTHVDYIADQIKNKLAEFLKKKKKLDVKPQIIKNQLKLFVNAYKIVNPVFDSQTKETLKTPKSKFGSTYEISDKFIINLAKTEILEKIQNQAAFKDSQLLSKSDGSKKKKVKVDKLSDADRAGTTESRDCTIIFTEGDSAKSMAISGLSEVGRDYYGVYPLRGKILNVRDAANTQIMNCKVLNDIKQILGLQSGKDYKKEFETTGTWPLRYGKMMLMTDQDHDGSHIKGLMMNLFDSMWPSLLELGFVTSMVTPIVKAKKGNVEKSFYTLQDYDKWKETTNVKSWTVKYYKGLGTSTSKEAKEYFKNLKIITYDRNQEETNSENEGTSGIHNNKLDFAFNEKRADDRKEWLREYRRNVYPDFNKTKMSFDEFVDEELIHFSNEDNERSIPSIVDGLKPSQRKILYGSFKRNLNSEVKVAQLAGYISEHAAYHHGEVSLEQTIKGMAQDFVGSNNVNLLLPIGQFGTRIMGGSDSAQSRYIFTHLNKITRSIFKKEDDPLCNYLDDDGYPIEPEYYYPVIPMVLVNGTKGIGTGFSTDIPKYNPVELCNYIKNKITGKANGTLKPWYRGFNGTIFPMTENPSKFISRGRYEIVNDSTVKVTELPVGLWTEDYIDYLEKVSVERGKDDSKCFVKSYKDDSYENHVCFTIKMNPGLVKKWVHKIGKDGINELENKLKLTTTISTSNMHVFNSEGTIVKYDKVDELIDEWYNVRSDIYVKRRNYMLDNLKKELDIIKYKVQFILEIIDETLEIRNVKKSEIIQKLEEHEYPKIPTKDDNPSYDYLLGMDLYKLTQEEIEELKNKKELKEAEYNALLNKTSDDLWIDDIDEILNELVKLMSSTENLGGNHVKKPVIKRKIKVKNTE